MAKLKVYRTPIGFHDAYVAAPSQKAALAAWGSDKDLFARGVAELVEDPALTKEPLDEPGKVIRRLRATADEQLAALPPDKPKAPAKPKANAEPERARPKPAPKPKPRPSRAALDAAEQAIDEAAGRRRDALADLDDRQAALDRERQKLTRESEAEEARLTRTRDAARKSYDTAMRRWRA